MIAAKFVCSRCGGDLNTPDELAERMCERCEEVLDEAFFNKDLKPSGTTSGSKQRYRCTECDSPLLTEEEEANMMCGGCMEKSA